MAKLEKDIRTDLSKLMAYLDRGILEGSVSALLERKLGERKLIQRLIF